MSAGRDGEKIVSQMRNFFFKCTTVSSFVVGKYFFAQLAGITMKKIEMLKEKWHDRHLRKFAFVFLTYKIILKHFTTIFFSKYAYFGLVICGLLLVKPNPKKHFYIFHFRLKCFKITLHFMQKKYKKCSMTVVE